MNTSDIKNDYCRKISEIDRLHGEVDTLKYALSEQLRTNERLEAIRREYRAARLEAYQADTDRLLSRRRAGRRESLFWAVLGGMSIGGSVVLLTALILL